MSRIIGVACDNCGILDVEVNPYTGGITEDSFPRNNWISLNQWGSQEEGVVDGEEIHICSTQCLFDFSKKALEGESVEEHHHHEQD